MANRVFLAIGIVLCTVGSAHACQIHYDTKWASGAAFLFWISLPATILFLIYNRFIRKKADRKSRRMLFLPPALLVVAILTSSYGLYKASPKCPAGAYFDAAMCSCVKLVPKKAAVQPSKSLKQSMIYGKEAADEKLLESVRQEHARAARAKKEYLYKACFVSVLWLVACLFLAFGDVRNRKD